MQHNERSAEMDTSIREVTKEEFMSLSKDPTLNYEYLNSIIAVYEVSKEMFDSIPNESRPLKRERDGHYYIARWR
jgi:hypothetical protein